MTVPRNVVAALLIAAPPAVAWSQDFVRFAHGWDVFNEPLDIARSFVATSVARDRLVLNYTLRGATPEKVYQVGLVLYCAGRAPLPSFGQFTAVSPDCGTFTRQGVTEQQQVIELGAVATDGNGDGQTSLVVKGLPPGTYSVQFSVRDGVGCEGVSGGGAGVNCNIVFEAPGPFGTSTRFTVP